MRLKEGSVVVFLNTRYFGTAPGSLGVVRMIHPYRPRFIRVVIKDSPLEAFVDVYRRDSIEVIDPPMKGL